MEIEKETRDYKNMFSHVIKSIISKRKEAYKLLNAQPTLYTRGVRQKTWQGGISIIEETYFDHSKQLKGRNLLAEAAKLEEIYNKNLSAHLDDIGKYFDNLEEDKRKEISILCSTQNRLNLETKSKYKQIEEAKQKFKKWEQ